MKFLPGFFFLFLSLGLKAQNITCKNFDGNSNIEKKTKQLKTYTAEYWKIAVNQAAKLPTPLQKKGFVVGDYHFNNVGIYFNYAKNKPDLVINDFDDAGYNYLIVDLFKYMTYIQKVDSDTDPEKLLKYYSQGLQQKNVDMPSEIREILEKDQHGFGKSYANYIENRKSEIQEFNKAALSDSQKSKALKMMQTRLIKKLSNVDYMMKSYNSGSSKDIERYEFIGSDLNGNLGVVEFKGLKCSASGSEQQQNLTENFEYIKTFYLNNFSSALLSHQFIYSMDDEYFLVREKAGNPLKKLEIEKMNKNKLQYYANYFAFFLGTIHARSSDKKYIESIDQYAKEIIESAKHIAKKFKALVKE